jgi:hypothetical protein
MTKQDRPILLPLMAAMFGIGTACGLIASGQPFVLEVSNPSFGKVLLRREYILMSPLPPNVGGIEKTNLNRIA